MFQLTREQKISNYQELLASKRKKVENLEREISSIERKILSLQSNNSEQFDTKIKTSTDLNLIPEAVRDRYTYDPTASPYQPGSFSF